MVEDFQLGIVEELFAGYRNVLAVLPTGNAKTTLAGGIGLYFCQFKPGARVPIGAAAKDQAAILYEQAAGFVRRSPGLLKRFKIQDGYRRIVGLEHGSLLRIYSAQDDTGDGIIPDLFIIDEYHRHRNDGLYSTWLQKLTKRDGQGLTISTAGSDAGNQLEELRDTARRLPNVSTGLTPRHVVARSDGREFCMHEFALKHGDDPHDLELVKHANPLSQITPEELRMRRDDPATKPWAWSRFTCNLRSKGEDTAIQPERWDSLLGPGVQIDRKVPTFIGLDLGWKVDHTGITPLGWESAERRIVAGAVTLAPPVDEDDIVRALCGFYLSGLNVRGVVYDPNAGGQQMAQLLEKGTHPVQVELDCPPMRFIEHSQDNAPMALASTRLDEAIRNGWLVHDGARVCGDPACRCGGFRGHVLNAVEKVVGGEKWKYDRPSDARGGSRRKYPIDGLTGLEIANSVAVMLQRKSRPRFEVIA